VGPFAFWAVGIGVAVAALPLSSLLFRRSPALTFGLAMPVGILVGSWAVFTLRVVDVLPPGRGGFVAAAVGLAAAGCLAGRRWPGELRTVRVAWRTGIALLVLFSLLFFLFTWFRSYTGEIGGTEQPMDLMYLASALESPDYPPEDLWFAGEPASYYYFGYVQVAWITALADVPASTGYNLGLALIFAEAGTAAAALAYAAGCGLFAGQRGRWPIVGAGAAVVALLASGSLSAPFEWAAAHENYDRGLYARFGVDWLLPCETAPGETPPESGCYAGPSPRTDAWYPTEFWFWWRGSRIIPDTITEFPAFSFLLGDLHPHVMSLPVMLLAAGLALAGWGDRRRPAFTLLRRRPAEGALVAVILGALAFTNAWDVVTFVAAYALVVAARARPMGWAAGARGAAGYLAPILALAALAYLPWYLTFSSQADGLYPYIDKGTIPAHAFLQYGTLLGLAVAGLAAALRTARRSRVIDQATMAVWVPLLPFLGWLAFSAARGELTGAVEDRSAAGWWTLGGYAVITWGLGAAAMVAAGARRPLAPLLGLAALGVLLLMGTELFYIGDVFRGFIPRQNTVFKLGYQAWAVLAVTGGVLLALSLRALWAARPEGVLGVPAALLLGTSLVYLVVAIPNRTDAFRAEPHVDGHAGLARSRPDEYALVRWMQSNTRAGAIILEATGRTWRDDGTGKLAVVNGPSIDYNEPGRVSARTGRATPIGWPGHEIQWRGDGPATQEAIARRQALVDEVYVTADVARGLAAARELGAEYVVVGRVERERYFGDLDAHLGRFLDLEWRQGEVSVYRVPVQRLLETS
jgi:YYY domain-containing protein